MATCYAGIKMTYEDKPYGEIMWSGYSFINNIIIDFLKKRKTVVTYETTTSIYIDISYQDFDILQAYLSGIINYEFWKSNRFRIEDIDESADKWQKKLYQMR